MMLNKEEGLKMKQDGMFGDEMMKAVRGFQKKNGMPEDGMVGQKMREMLLKMQKKWEFNVLWFVRF